MTSLSEYSATRPHMQEKRLADYRHDARVDGLDAAYPGRKHFRKSEAADYWQVSIASINRWLGVNPWSWCDTIAGVRITRAGMLAIGGNRWER